MSNKETVSVKILKYKAVIKDVGTVEAMTKKELSEKVLEEWGELSVKKSWILKKPDENAKWKSWFWVGKIDEEPHFTEDVNTEDDGYTMEMIKIHLDAFKTGHDAIEKINKMNLKNGSAKRSRHANFPSEISENIVKMIIEKKYEGNVKWITGGDLFHNGDKIEVKAFSADGPCSFGPRSTWERLYILDARKFHDDTFICYEFPFPNSYPTWQEMKVNSQQTYQEQCRQGRRPHINFGKINEQVKLTKIFEGDLFDLENL